MVAGQEHNTLLLFVYTSQSRHFGAVSPGDGHAPFYRHGL